MGKCFENLCQRGDFVDPEAVFSSERLEDLDYCTGSNHIIKHANRESGQVPCGSSQPQPKASLLATPSFTTRGSSTSTPILPISSVQTLPPNNPQIPQPVIFVTPISEQAMAPNIDFSDSCFTGSPRSGIQFS